MQPKSHITVARAALLLIVATVLLTGGMGMPGIEGLESVIGPVRARFIATLTAYRDRVRAYRAHIAHTIRAGEYGRTGADSSVPEPRAASDRNEDYSTPRIPPETPVVAPAADRPPPESPLVKRKPPINHYTSPAALYDGRRSVIGASSTETPRSTRPHPKRAVLVPAVSSVSWTHGPRNRPRVALSFDSGEMSAGRIGCGRLIDHLVSSGTPATFFLTGRFAEGYPDIVRRIGGVSHFELGNHSHSHPDLTGKPAEAVAEEILRTQRVIHRISGRRGRLFRPPYGKTSSTVNDVAARYGLHTVLWDVAADDYRKEVSGTQVAKSVLAGARNGSIVLLHMHGDESAACEALPEIIAGLRVRGFELVKVSTLIDDARAE